MFIFINSSIYKIFPSISRKYQGIIVDVKKWSSNKDLKDCVILEIGILITRVDETYNYAGLLPNQRYQFLVSFSPGGFTQDELSYYSFFAGGRRMEFDIIDLYNGKENGELFTVSKAYSL